MRSREGGRPVPVWYRLSWRIDHWHRGVMSCCKVECGGAPHIAQQDSATIDPSQTSNCCGMSRERIEAMAIRESHSMRSTALPTTNEPQEGNATHRLECQDIPPHASRPLSGPRLIRSFGRLLIAGGHTLVPIGFSHATEDDEQPSSVPASLPWRRCRAASRVARPHRRSAGSCLF